MQISRGQSWGPPKRRRIWLIVVASFLVLVLAWLGFCFSTFSRPTLDRPTRADAIVVLGQPDVAALAKAQRLIDEGISDQLVLAIPHGATPQCETPPKGVTVHCFVPDPSTTQGDARGIGKLARAHRWSRLVIITWTSHVSRSRMLIARCFHGHLQMTDYPRHMSLTDWLSEYVYQSGAYVKALALPGC